MTTKWCEVCDEIEATTQKNKKTGLFRLCVNCEQVMYYWRRRPPGALLDRRDALALAKKRNTLLLGEMNVTPIDIAEDQKVA
jgi:hypothetical protein